MSKADKDLANDLRNHTNGGMADTRTLDRGGNRIDAMVREIRALTKALKEKQDGQD